MTTRRIRLLLTARPGDAASLEAQLAGVGEASADPAISVAWGMRTPGDPIAGTEHRAALGPAPEQFDAVVDITGDDVADGALVDVARSVVGRVTASINLARSALTFGGCHVLMPATGPHMMVFALRAPPTMTREQFFDYWVNTHAPLIVQQSRGRGSYQHLRADPGQAAIAAALGVGICDYLGHAGGWMADPANIGAFLRHPNALEALADERNFIDHSRSFIGVYAIQGRAGSGR